MILSFVLFLPYIIPQIIMLSAEFEAEKQKHEGHGTI